MSVLNIAPQDSYDLQGVYSYTDLKSVYYGPGCVEKALPALLQKLGAKKALIVTGKSLFEKVHK
jgi:alcohol dehydrogenase class IV